MRVLARRILQALAPAFLVACGNTSHGTASAAGSGGTTANGRATSSGGAIGNGGTPANGGAIASGAVPTNGGAVSSGGVTASGGQSASGGAGGGGTGPGGGAGSGVGGLAGNVDAGAPGTRRLAAPPMYSGTVNNGADCSHPYATHGFEPDDAPGARHPLFLYFTGTNFVTDEAAFRDQSAPAADAVTEAMARRGFVAIWAEYDNGAIAWLSDHVAQLKCLFDTDTTSILAVACALPQVDCNLGIATWGHSQGAYVAIRAHDFDARARAAWLAGYGGDAQPTLPKNRLRVENGEGDTTNGQPATVNAVTGLTDAECPDNGTSSCFRADGSGWVIVRAKDCVTSTADHCWFDRKTCTDSQVILEHNWVDPASTKPFALESNADWIAATARKPL
jgi:hypothetical protein